MVNQHFSIKDIDNLLSTTIRNNVDKDHVVIYTIIEKSKTNKVVDTIHAAYGNVHLIFDYCLKVFKNPQIDTVVSQVDFLKKCLRQGMSLDEVRHLFEVALFCVEKGIAESILSHIPKKGGYDD